MRPTLQDPLCHARAPVGVVSNSEGRDENRWRNNVNLVAHPRVPSSLTPGYPHLSPPGTYLHGPSRRERVELDHPVTAEGIFPQVLGPSVAESLDHGGLVPGCPRSFMCACERCNVIVPKPLSRSHSPMPFVAGAHSPSCRHESDAIWRRLGQPLDVLGCHFHRVSEPFELDFPYVFGNAANDDTIVPNLLEFGTYYLQSIMPMKNIVWVSTEERH